MHDDADRVRSAYAARADEYAAVLGSMEATAQGHRELVADWAGPLRGPVLDVGCGPGHWSSFLTELGAEVIGIDPVAEFLTVARHRHHGPRWAMGRAETLPVADAAAAGILAWYSLIHLHPDRIGLALTEFARVLAPGGSLALGFFTGERIEAFAHAVHPAHYWPIPAMTERLAAAGFVVTAVDHTQQPGSRPHAGLLARLTDDPVAHAGRAG